MHHQNYILDILWQFDKSTDRLPDAILYKKRDLLKVYGSQREVLDWFSPWYEKITKVNIIDES